MTAGLSHKRVVILLFVLHATLLAIFAFTRLVDADEGWYLSAGAQIAAGKTIYTDFFYPQMPYLPFLFSFFSGHGFTTLYMSRLAGVLAGLAAMLVFYALLRRETTDSKTSLFLLAVYALCGLNLAWHSVAKTYPWSDFFLIAAFYFLIRTRETNRLIYAALAGIAAALFVNIRLILAPAALLFTGFFLFGAVRKRQNGLAAYLGAFLAASLPAVAIYLNDPQRFYFDNLGFHLMRNPTVPFPASLVERLAVAGRMIYNPQTLLLFALAAFAFVLWYRTRKTFDIHQLYGSARTFAGLTAFVIAVVYLLPNPIHQQYFVQIVPFVLLAATPAVDKLLLGSRSADNRKARGFLLGKLLLAVYVIGVIPYFIVFVGAIRYSDRSYAINNLKDLTTYLKENKSDGPIFAEWVGIPILANLQVADGLDYIGYEYGLPLKREEVHAIHLPLNKDMHRILAEQEAAAYVVTDYPDSELLAVAEANYREEKAFDRFKVWGRK
jgi:hypothetical protein